MTCTQACLLSSCVAGGYWLGCRVHVSQAAGLLLQLLLQLLPLCCACLRRSTGISSARSWYWPTWEWTGRGALSQPAHAALVPAPMAPFTASTLTSTSASPTWQKLHLLMFSCRRQTSSCFCMGQISLRCSQVAALLMLMLTLSVPAPISMQLKHWPARLKRCCGARPPPPAPSALLPSASCIPMMHMCITAVPPSATTAGNQVSCSALCCKLSVLSCNRGCPLPPFCSLMSRLWVQPCAATQLLPIFWTSAPASAISMLPSCCTCSL